MAPTVLALAGRATARTYAAEIIGFWATTQKSRKSPAFQFDEFKVLRCGIVLHYNLNPKVTGLLKKSQKTSPICHTNEPIVNSVKLSSH